jgi:hypothetical protein
MINAGSVRRQDTEVGAVSYERHQKSPLPTVSPPIAIGHIALAH